MTLRWFHWAMIAGAALLLLKKPASGDAAASEVNAESSGTSLGGAFSSALGDLLGAVTGGTSTPGGTNTPAGTGGETPTLASDPIPMAQPSAPPAPNYTPPSLPGTYATPEAANSGFSGL